MNTGKATIEWQDNMSVGVPAVDNDHKSMIAFINQILSTHTVEEDEGVIGTVLNSIYEYTLYHFAREEKILERVHYPDLAQHKQLHADLAQQVLDEVDAFIANPTTFNLGTLNDFLCHWWTGHILDEDMAYIPYTANNDELEQAANSIDFLSLKKLSDRY